LHVLAIGSGSDAAAASAVAKALKAAAPKEYDEVQPRILQGQQATPEAIVAEQLACQSPDIARADR